MEKATLTVLQFIEGHPYRQMDSLVTQEHLSRRIVRSTVRLLRNRGYLSVDAKRRLQITAKGKEYFAQRTISKKRNGSSLFK